MIPDPDYIAVSEFQEKCLGLLDEVAQKHGTIVVTKFGKPIARVLPVENTRVPLLGSWADTVQVVGDIVHFDSSAEWESQ